MHYLAVCCIAKDENKNIKEWLAYHAAIGVEHFYIYDNMSEQPIADYIAGFADKAQVTCTRIEGQGVQMQAYKDCLSEYGADCRWIAFIDIDEFICPVKMDDLRIFLSEYEHNAAVAVNWKLFSSSGHLRRPAGLVIESYTQHIYHDQANLIVKCIVQPRRVKYVSNPHIFGYHDGFYVVNADGIPAFKNSSRCLRSTDKITIHHYQSKSQQDFEDKQVRGRGDVPKGVHDFPYSSFYQQAASPWREDTCALRFAPQVRSMLNANRLATKTLKYEPETIVDKVSEVLLADSDDFTATDIHLCHASLYYEDNPFVWWSRAYIWHCRGDLKKALYFAESGLKYVKNGKLCEEYFYLCAKLGKFEKAAAMLEFMDFNIDRQDEGSIEAFNKMKTFLTGQIRSFSKRG